LLFTVNSNSAQDKKNPVETSFIQVDNAIAKAKSAAATDPADADCDILIGDPREDVG